MANDKVYNSGNKTNRRYPIGRARDNVIHADKSFASRVLAHGMQVLQLNPDRSRPASRQELEDRCNKYFELCVQNGLPPTVEGLAIISGYERRTLFQITRGDFSQQFADTLIKAKDYIAMFDATLAMSGEIPAQVYSFRSKNFYGMKDIQEIKAVPQDNTVPENQEDILEALPENPNEQIEGKSAEK